MAHRHHAAVVGMSKESSFTQGWQQQVPNELQLWRRLLGMDKVQVMHFEEVLGLEVNFWVYEFVWND